MLPAIVFTEIPQFAVRATTIQRNMGTPTLILPKIRRRNPCRAVVLASVMLTFGLANAEEPQRLGLDDFVRLMDQRHPRLAQANLAIEAAYGRADQASRYPNPTLDVSGAEINDRTGPSGIWSPFFTQEIVRRDKRRLDIAAAQQAIQESTWLYYVERFALLTRVRERYFDVLALQRRAETLERAAAAQQQLVELARRLEAAGQGTRIDLLNAEIALRQIDSDLEATRASYRAAFHRLGAVVGEPDLPVVQLVGTLDAELPQYDLETLVATVRQSHPQILAARVAVNRAHLLLRRAEVERKPNITLGAGYVWQGQNRSHDWSLAIRLPIPLWNRNEGNIRAAQAEVGQATLEIRRLELELSDRIAEAFQRYAAGKRRAESFRDQILPRARDAFDLAVKGQAAGQIDSVRVLLAQRTLLDNELEGIRHMSEAWQAAAVLSGLMLEEAWPIFPK
ncbi:MAG: TolC family protein [Gemmataceae bacterium]|nr:TolC family protein [Gemmataceae bacterium]